MGKATGRQEETTWVQADVVVGRLDDDWLDQELRFGTLPGGFDSL